MTALPAQFDSWFSSRGWQLHPHQREMYAARDEKALLLVAPTGGGKTLAGFLPTLAELAQQPHDGLHTLYVSPLKALAADIKRNLRTPVEEMGLAVRIEDRTGDTSAHTKRRQRADPPHILLTTPESLALLLSYEDAPRIFGGLNRVVIDEIHALAESKRGDQLMLCLSRLQALCPDMRRVGLSATIEDVPAMGRYLAPYPRAATIVHADPGPAPDIAMLETQELPPWAGGGAAYAIPRVLEEIREHKTTLIFHNTRAQAEIFFRNLWLANDEGLPIGIHHGSLEREQREKVEAAMIAGKLRAVVCTGTLDLGIDWGDVDLVIQIGAPKNVKRLVQRIGRANHRYNAPSKARLVPANRFEMVECVAALDAMRAGELDGDTQPKGPRDVLCQHILIRACSGPFTGRALYDEVKSVGVYADMTRAEFDACLDFVATGGYALRAYDQWQRLKEIGPDHYQLRDPRAARRFRMNLGTIMDADRLKVKLRGRRAGKTLGEIEESFAATLSPGDTFLMGGEVVRYEGLREMVVEVSRNPTKKPKVAVFSGTKFATSTQLSHRILDMFETRDFDRLAPHTADWLRLQEEMSSLPARRSLLIEGFPHDGRQHLCIYGFAGRNAMQTLGLMLTKRMEEEGLAPMGFVSSDYALLIWGLDQVEDPTPLLERTALMDGFDRWLAGNAVMKRTFKNAATIAGLIERNLPGLRKSGRQTTISSDILYDVLVRHDPSHLMLDITREEALKGLVDFGRIEEMLDRVEEINFKQLAQVSPLAAPLFLEVGKVPIQGEANERLLMREAERALQIAGLE